MSILRALAIALLLAAPAGRVDAGPSLGQPVVFAGSVHGAEGIAFQRGGRLVVRFPYQR